MKTRIQKKVTRIQKKNRPFSSSATATLALAGALLAGVFAACDKAETTAPVVDPNARITLTKPVGGESFKLGDSLRVRWTVKEDLNDPIQAVDVLFSPDNGTTWIDLPWPNLARGSIKPISPYWNNFSWKITDSLYSSGIDAKVKVVGCTQCLVRVKDYTVDNIGAAGVLKRSTSTSLTITP